MKIAIVTGASSGLGREFVYDLDKRGGLDEIWVIARRESRLLELGENIKTKIRVLAYDLTKKESIRAISDMLNEESPSVAVLINAAGFGKIGSVDDISLEDCEDMIDLNCRASVAMVKVTVPFMAPKSHILQISSTSAFQPFQYLNVYAASKAFLYRYSRALRIELLPRQIYVTVVCPYWIKDAEFINTAQDTKNSTYIRSFLFSSRVKSVVKWAMRDAKLCLPVSTPGPVCFIHRIVAKFVPHSIMMGIWGILRRI